MAESKLNRVDPEKVLPVFKDKLDEVLSNLSKVDQLPPYHLEVDGDKLTFSVANKDLRDEEGRKKIDTIQIFVNVLPKFLQDLGFKCDEKPTKNPILHGEENFLEATATQECLKKLTSMNKDSIRDSYLAARQKYGPTLKSTGFTKGL